MAILSFTQLYTPAKLVGELAAVASAQLQPISGIVPTNFAIQCDDSAVAQVNSIVAAHQPDAATQTLKNTVNMLRQYYAGNAAPTQDQINKGMLLVLKTILQDLS